MSTETGRLPFEYRGARFYKCDLQMQTPFDSHHWMGEKYSSEDEAAAAFIRACYIAELEVIAITEHNFVSRKQLPLLQAKAKELAGEFGYELVIFPGFEFTANVGKGVHVLALFEQDADLDQLDHLLTNCGVPHPRQNSSGQHERSNKGLDDILKIVQAPTADGGLKGLVILPHIQSESGIFDDDKIAEWLQQREFVNSDLLAVEVPKSPSRMTNAWKKLFGNGDDCQPGWKRSRPICCLMSSDAKTLVSSQTTENAVGSKYTWVKMSKPSIEAMRQAFLDHDSRIRRCDDFPDRPEALQTHPWIEEIVVRDAKFLADKRIHFSPNLTTIIGGRGTGKSTLIEYIRLALGRESEIEGDKSSQLSEDFQNVRDTLANGSHVALSYNKGADFKFLRIPLTMDSGIAAGIDPKHGDINTFLPIKIYSRGQIEAIANDTQKQASIIDDLITAPLDAIRNEERDVTRQLRDLNESLRQEGEIASSRLKLIADVENLNARIDAIKSKHSSLAEWSKWSAESQYLQALEMAATAHLKTLQTALDQEFFHKTFEGTEGNAKFLNSHQQALVSLMVDLRGELAEAIHKAMTALAGEIISAKRQEWQQGFSKVEEENKTSIEELAELGISFDAYDELFRRREVALNQLAELEKRLVEITANRTSFQEIYKSKLLDIWNRQFELRADMAARLNAQVTKTKVGTPTVASMVQKHGDFRSFLDMMTPYNKDKRTISQVDWETMMRAAFDIALKADSSPIDVLMRWMDDAAETRISSDFPKDDVQPKKLESLLEWLTEHDLNLLRTNRIADSVTVSLHRRDDGLKVGDLTGRKLSAGQKATTVLSLLLAEGTCPIIIDQPEDDLDNEFVFQQLVPMLRASKEKRQIIVVTHNANVPVNGDAELIIPLEVKDSRGAQKVIDNELTVGALDRHPVQRAVELILEGSSEAFRRRREKYGV